MQQGGGKESSQAEWNGDAIMLFWKSLQLSASGIHNHAALRSAHQLQLQ